MTAPGAFSGERAGVRFVEGVADDVPEGAALAYFRRSGRYGIEPDPEPAPPAPPAPAKSKSASKR